MLMTEISGKAMESDVNTYCRVRRKKTRRGKKKHNRMIIDFDASVLDSSVCVCGNITDVEYSPSHEVSLNKISIAPFVKKRSRRRSQRCLRPYTSPRAPPNSTQFLIEDHILACKMADQCISDSSFVLNTVPSDDPGFFGCDYICQENSEQCLSPIHEDVPLFDWKTSPAFSDPDYEYDLPENDMMNFMEQDFEQAFKEAREQELNCKSKSELFCEVKTLANYANDLHHQLFTNIRGNNKNNNMIENLKKELEQLSEENAILIKENEHLKDSSIHITENVV